MMYRVFAVAVVVLAAVCLAMPFAYAQDKSHEGFIVKAADNKVTMTDKDKKNQHTHDVAPDAKITCDGKACLLKDLREGYRVTVTLRNNSNVAIRIEAKSKG
jgi:hypothetical protein